MKKYPRVGELKGVEVTAIAFLSKTLMVGNKDLIYKHH